MVTVSLREGRLASLEHRWSGCQALGQASSEGPQDSVSLLGIRDGRVRLIDYDDEPNLRLRLEQSPEGETLMVLQNPGQQASPTIVIGLDCHVPCDQEWLSFDKLGPGVRSLTVTPRPGGAELEVVTRSTGGYTFSQEGIRVPGVFGCATIEVSQDRKDIARQALA